MNIQIQSRPFALTDSLRQYAQDRLLRSLSHGRKSIVRAVVRLADINGPRGGSDKRCTIELRLQHSATLVVQDQEADMYNAIDNAVQRISRVLDRHLAKRHLQRQPYLAPKYALI